MKIDVEECAPVIIPTLCRYEHFKRCVESLQKNDYAKYTDLYIGLDYPAKEAHVQGHDKIKEYLSKGIKGFKNVVIIEHDSNVGSSANAKKIKEEAFLKHDKYIFTEDDNEFAPNYLEYMNKCLIKYKDDPSVQAITGYRYPHVECKVNGNVFASQIYYAAFGCGTWKSKMQNMFETLTVPYFEQLYTNGQFMKELRNVSPNQYCNFVKGMLGYTKLVQGGKIWRCDMIYGIYMFSQGKRMIFPQISKVRNHGYDGTGINCGDLNYNSNKRITHRNFDISCQVLDSNSAFDEINEEKELKQIEVEKMLEQFFEIPAKELMRTEIAYLISKIIGLTNTRKLIQLMYKK